MINSHERIALELSGGKDSLAVLYLLRADLHRITVYWCNPGDPDPSVMDSIAWARSISPNFVEVRTDIASFRKQFGYPSSVVPMSSDTLPIISEQICCMHNIMIPLENRVREDKNTLIIRGQKNCDADKGKLRDGDWFNGVQYHYPIEEWDDDEVMTYLVDNHVPIPKVYEYSSHGIDCLHCTGWWKHDHLKYLQDNHRDAFVHVAHTRELIRASIEKEMMLC